MYQRLSNSDTQSKEHMTKTDIYALASQASQGRGREREEITPLSIDPLKLFDVSFPDPCCGPLSRLAIVSTSNSCFGDKESPQTT